MARLCLCGGESADVLKFNAVFAVGDEEGNTKCVSAFGEVGQRVWTREAWKQAQSAALFVASCRAIRGPSAHNRLCLKGIHGLAPRLCSPRLCTEARAAHFHAPFYLIANGNSARRSHLSASFQQFEQHIFVFLLL